MCVVRCCECVDPPICAVSCCIGGLLVFGTEPVGDSLGWNTVYAGYFED